MLPHFLIIGGMKCGSTTLYRDMGTNPAVFFPVDKEPENLTRDDVLTDAGRAAYARLFDPARPEQTCGEASTAYTKLPDHAGVAGRARALLGAGLRVIYIVREPVARVASHHHHELSVGAMPASLDEALRTHPALLNYSRYAMQARAWIDALGADNVRIVRFEDYTRNRAAVTAELSTFIGVEPRPDLVEPDKVFNKSDAKPVMTGPWRLVVGNPIYQATLRKVFSQDTRTAIRNLVLPKSKHARRDATPEQARRIYDALADDLAELATLMGRTGPVWERDAVTAALAK